MNGTRHTILLSALGLFWPGPFGPDPLGLDPSGPALCLKYAGPWAHRPRAHEPLASNTRGPGPMGPWLGHEGPMAHGPMVPLCEAPMGRFYGGAVALSVLWRVRFLSSCVDKRSQEIVIDGLTNLL